MSKRNNEPRKSQLALAIAGGSTVKAWAKKNRVASRTAYTWAGSPEVVRLVARIRGRALDCAIGRLSKNATAAAKEIARLAKKAESEAVKLNASRAVLADLMSISNYATLEKRLDELERRVQDGCQQVPTSPSRRTTSNGKRKTEKGG